MLLMDSPSLLEEVKKRLVVDAMEISVVHSGKISCKGCHVHGGIARLKGNLGQSDLARFCLVGANDSLESLLSYDYFMNPTPL